MMFKFKTSLKFMERRSTHHQNIRFTDAIGRSYPCAYLPLSYHVKLLIPQKAGRAYWNF